MVKQKSYLGDTILSLVRIPVHAATPLNVKSMRNVQRLSPCGRVKSQANGERKIRPLMFKGEQIVYARPEKE